MHGIKVMDGFPNRIGATPAKMQGANAKIFSRVGVGANAGTKSIGRPGKVRRTTKLEKEAILQNRKMKADTNKRRRKPEVSKQMQGFNRIMQGYQRGTKEDLEDWDFLVNIEHPCTMNGFEAWLDEEEGVLNGRKERRQRRAARRAQRQQKKAERGAQKAARQGARAERKQKRQQRREAGQERRERRKETRTAKKEERLQRKQSRRQEREKDREARRKRRELRITERRKRQEARQAARADRQAGRQERRGEIFENIADVGQNILPGIFGQEMPFDMQDIDLQTFGDLARGGGAFEDFSFSDLPGQFRTPMFDDFVTGLQDMPPEDALRFRDEMEKGLDDLPDDGEGSNNLVPLLIGAGIIAAVAMGGKKGKK
jgi:hypothetical protein